MYIYRRRALQYHWHDLFMLSELAIKATVSLPPDKTYTVLRAESPPRPHEPVYSMPSARVPISLVVPNSCMVFSDRFRTWDGLQKLVG